MRELNLVPYEIRFKKERELKIRNYIAGAAILLCVLFVGVYVPKLRFISLKNKEAELKQQIELKSSIMNENQKINSEINNINIYTDKINVITKDRVLVSNKIESIGKYIPQDINLFSLNYDNNSVTLNGTTKTYSSVAEFAANLQSSKEFKSVELSTINGEGVNNESTSKYNFTVVISY